MPDLAQSGPLLEAFGAGLRERRDMPAALKALAKAARADAAVLVRDNPGSLFIDATATPGMISSRAPAAVSVAASDWKLRRAAVR